MAEKVLIIGHGLAGCAVAWQLWWCGVPFCVVDEAVPLSSSKVAAGLLTPITGMRLSVAREHAEELGHCLAHFRRVQQLLGQRWLHVRSHVRLFRRESEWELWQRRRAEAGIRRFLSPEEVKLDEEVFHPAGQGFQMRQGGWVDTAAYLVASQQHWQQALCWQQGKVQVSELKLTNAGCEWQGQHYSHVVDCTGWAAGAEARWSWLPWQSAKGTLLTLRADLKGERRVLHRGCWLVPRPDGSVRAGSTYGKDLSRPFEPDEEDLQELLGSLGQLLRVPWSVQQSVTAVRPILQRQRCVVGRHPAWDRLLLLNGLGSKGTLRAPRLAHWLVQHLLEGKALPAAVDVRAENW